MSGKANLLLRLRAAFWCATVAGALCAFVVLYRSPNPPAEVFWGIMLSAMAPAAISGFLVGWHLLDSSEDHNAITAIGLGLAVVLLAYPILFFIWALVTIASEQPNWTTLNDPETTSTFMMLFCFFIPVFALLFTGWITLPAGGIVAYLLSRRYRKKRLSDSPQQEPQPVELPNSEDQQRA